MVAVVGSQIIRQRVEVLIYYPQIILLSFTLVLVDLQKDCLMMIEMELQTNHLQAVVIVVPQIIPHMEQVELQRLMR